MFQRLLRPFADDQMHFDIGLGQHLAAVQAYRDRYGV
jgi:hypothetical protein